MWHIIAVAGGALCFLVVVHQALQWWKRRKACAPCGGSTRGSCVNSVGPSCTLETSEFIIEQKDSIDEHLDILTRKLADKEGRLRISKSKIRQTQNEIENLHAIDNDVQKKYREVMENLKNDLLSNERDCKQLQEQIEWVSRRRAELREEVVRGQHMYSEAVTGLARGLHEISHGARPASQYVMTAQSLRVAPPLTESASKLWAAFERQEQSCSSVRSRPAAQFPQREESKMKTVGTTPLAGMPRYIR